MAFIPLKCEECDLECELVGTQVNYELRVDPMRFSRRCAYAPEGVSHEHCEDLQRAKAAAVVRLPRS
jgi:hypothetical protein